MFVDVLFLAKEFCGSLDGVCSINSPGVRNRTAYLQNLRSCSVRYNSRRRVAPDNCNHAGHTYLSVPPVSLFFVPPRLSSSDKTRTNWALLLLGEQFAVSRITSRKWA